MIPVSREITDLKSEFEGGNSFSVDWYGLLRRGGEAVLDNINPETLKRVAPIYGGLTRDLTWYYCPPDVQVPSRLITRDTLQAFNFVPSAQFYAQGRYNAFTIEYRNNVRYIVVRASTPGTVLLVNSMEEVGTLTGTVALVPNTYNVLPGASGALQGTFSDSAYNIGDTLSEILDITTILRGVALIPVYLDSAKDVEFIKFRLKTDDDNYYEVSSLLDSVGDFIGDGQNMVRFWMNSAVQTGAPDPANITGWELDVKMNAGAEQTVIIGKITLQLSHIFFLEYYSNRLFIDGTTGSWKDTPTLGDQINLDRNALGILHFETCRLVVQSAAFDRIDSAESQRFDTNLARKYDQYFGRNPSSEQPLSYNLMPNIPVDLEISGWGVPFSERVGDNIGSLELAGDSTLFSDNITPSGVINGVNAVFTLPHSPNPPASLQLWLNDQPQTQGVDYSLTGAIITFVTPPDIAFAGAPFVAFYRYAP